MSADLQSAILSGNINTTNTEQSGPSTLERWARLRDIPAASQRRRLSDPSSTANASTGLRSLPVRSTDGSRWLPTPDEQSHRMQSGQQRQSSTEAVDPPSLTQHACSVAVCAVTTVFQTTELLETILLETSIYDLFVLQRTNKTFLNTINGSPRIQRAMFLEPENACATTLRPKANPRGEIPFRAG